MPRPASPYAASHGLTFLGHEHALANPSQPWRHDFACEQELARRKNERAYVAQKLDYLQARAAEGGEHGPRAVATLRSIAMCEAQLGALDAQAGWWAERLLEGGGGGAAREHQATQSTHAAASDTRGARSGPAGHAQTTAESKRGKARRREHTATTAATMLSHIDDVLRGIDGVLGSAPQRDPARPRLRPLTSSASAPLHERSTTAARERCKR